MKTSRRCSPEVAERALGMVLEHEERFSGHPTPHEGAVVLTHTGLGRTRRSSALRACSMGAAALTIVASGCEQPGHPSLPLLPLQVDGYDTMVVIGQLDGDSTQIFGSIDAVAASLDGWFAVLDRQAARVSLFDPSGAFVGATRQGEGPGELSRPAFTTWVAPDHWAVYDGGNGRISIFRGSSGGGA